MKLKPIIFLTLFLLPSFIVPTTHALYVVPLPTNTYYADDFENYTSTTCTATTNTVAGTDNGQVTGCLPGWAYIDNNCNSVGDRAINQTYAFSSTHSLSLTVAKAAAKCDIDRRLAIHNSTSVVQMSIWFIFTTTMLSANNRASAVGDTGLHLALEYWDPSTHWEAVTFILANGCGAIATEAAVDFVGDGAPGVSQGTDHCADHLIRAFDATATTSSGYWHHLTVKINVLTHKWIAVELDDDNYNYIMANRALRSIVDNSWLNIGGLTGIRVEVAVIGQY